MTEARREYAKKWRAANREKTREYQAAYRAANGEKIAAERRKWSEKNPERLRQLKSNWYRGNLEKSRASSQRAAMLRKYGITPEQRDEMFAAQGFACKICKAKDPGSARGWHTDHCHTTGKVRGILCNHCNLMLGYAKDNRDTLTAAVNYLEGAQ